MGDLLRALRVLTLLATATATWSTLSLVSLRQLTAPSTHAPGGWLVDVAAALTVPAAGWLMFLMLVEVAGRLRAGGLAPRHRLLPGQRTVALLVAAALGTAPTAHADEAAFPAPDRTPLPATATRTSAERMDPPHTVTVRPGDSLWSIAADRLLEGGADVTTVQHTVDGLYALNQRAIGPEPDRIHPGTRLVVPQHHREEPA